MTKLFFGGAGWLFAFNFGAAQFFNDSLDVKSNNFTTSGASAGAVTALLLLLKTDFQKVLNYIYKQYENVKSNPFRMKYILSDVLSNYVPYDTFYKDCSNRLYVILSKYKHFKIEPHVINEFASRDLCISALKASCHIPVICGLRGTMIGNESFYDGGMVLGKIDDIRSNIQIKLDDDPSQNNLISANF